MQDVPSIQHFENSPFGGLLDFLNAWKQMEDRISHLEMELRRFQSKASSNKRFLNLDETCDTLNLKPSKVRALVRSGRLKRNLDVRHLQISVDSIEAYVKQVLPV